MLLGSGSIVALLSFAHAQYQPPAPKPPPPTLYVPSVTLPPFNPGPFPPGPPGPPGDYGPPPPPVYPTTHLPPSVPDIPTNEYVQYSINACADTLDKMEKETRNKKNSKLYRKVSKSLRKLRRLTFDRDTLRQVSGNVQRMNKATNRYKTKCWRTTSDATNYKQLDNQFNSKEDDTQWYNPTNSRRVAKVQSTMDAASQCIEDYCGY
ncbi:hypothetical protein V3C99_002247 [Haemonchus contortus]|uniref:DUF725 domain-containing protein n=1 Tax=Haemonchus contortus TaxID=6289 RepID=A0A7I4YCU2_HAECO